MRHSLIPTDNRALATRLQRQLMGFTSYLMFVVPLAYAVAQGWLRMGYAGVACCLAFAVVVNVGFFLLIRTRYSERFPDPSMVFAQVAAAGLFALLIGYFLDARAMVITLMLFFTAFFFGVFSFSTRKYLALTAAATAGYVSMLLLKYGPSERSDGAFHLELLQLLILVMVLLWMSLLGGYIAGLRSSLAHKKDALAAALTRLKELASRDELTGLHNRRHLMEILEQQQERAQRHAEPFALCIIDLDHFKRVNDTHGHGVGDEALRGFSERIRGHMRRMDIVGRTEADSTFGRYGGEEFLLLLPYAAGAGALACVERLRTAMRASPVPTSAGALPMSFSAGVAQYRPGESIAELLNRADEALYRAKSAGRDRVESAD